MIVRRDRAALRGGAGLLLVVACLVGPAAAQAAPTPDEVTPMQGGAECEGVAPSASAATTEAGNNVLVTGSCLPAYEQATISIFVLGDDSTRLTAGGRVSADGSVSAEFTPEVAGEYSIAIDAGGKQGTGGFTVTEPVEPEPVPDPEPTPDPTPDPSPTPEPTEDPTTAPDEDDSPASPSPSPSASPDPAPSTPTKPFPSADDDPAPTADAGPTASEQTPTSPATSSPAAASPGPATNDFPAATPEYTAEQRDAASLAVLMTSLFAHGVSNGQVGTSPAEAGTPNAGGTVGSASGNGDAAEGSGASDGGGDELAETGAEVTGPAALAALALTGGAGMLWQHRRRNG